MKYEYKPEYKLLQDAFLGFPMEEYFYPKLKYLVDMAEEEPWGFSTFDTTGRQRPYPILYNYLNYTYDRLKEEGKIFYSSDRKAMCFNTGLMTRYHQDIIMFFLRNTRFDETSSDKEWWFAKFSTIDDYEVMRYFREVPPLADYFQDPTQLIYDKNLSIFVDLKHILKDNLHRLRHVTNTWEVDKNLKKFQVAYEQSIKRLKRNYKLAVPQYYRDKSSKSACIQLLVPLHIEGRKRPELAMVMERISSEGEDVYRIKTIIPLKWAYMNARRIVKHDEIWRCYL